MAKSQENQTKNSAIGQVKPVAITEEMKSSYLDYAMSVIVSRALPDVRDGLKPVHRRLLYAMDKMGLTHSAKHTKSAKIVGEVLGKYHPHGDAPVYHALVRMAQDFSLRYPLIDGQGNFGSVDGDPPAAMRYSEAKMAPIAQELLADIEKETVDFVDNFDGSLQEPVFLPAKLPNLLLAGSEGIAVAVATRIPPHNLKEVLQAVLFMLDKGEVEEGGQFKTEAKVEDLLKFIQGPDFPTGGITFDWSKIKQVYKTGKGKVTIRAKTDLEKKGRRKKIIVSELPYQVNKADLVAKIASLVKDKRIRGISQIRDESDQRGMRIVLGLKRGVRHQPVLKRLFKFTDLQTIYPANLVALVNGTPRTLNLKGILKEFIKHRQAVVTRRSQFELNQAERRSHILAGLIIALKHLDAVITTIKRAKTAQVAKERLKKKFELSDLQAEAILQMRLRRLARLEREKIEKEYEQLEKEAKELKALLADPNKILKVVKKETEALIEKYKDERRTVLVKKPLTKFSEKDLIPQKPCLIIITQDGYGKRMSTKSYRRQRRGGKGTKGMKLKEKDIIAHLVKANTHDEILFFTNQGRVFKLPVYDLPKAKKSARGQALINLIDLKQKEEIQAALIPQKGKFLSMATKKGKVKRTKMEDYQNIRTPGKIAIKLSRGDQLCGVKATGGGDHLLLVTHQGQSIKFKESDIRPTARDTMGVKGVDLKKGDYVVSLNAFSAKAPKPKDKRRKFFRHLLVVTEKGFGKRTPLAKYPLQKRGGKGVKVAQITKKTGRVVDAAMVNQKIKNVILISKKGQVIKLPLKNISTLSRTTQGVILMRFTKKSDAVAALTCL